MFGCSKDSLILIPFRLPQISCFTLSLKCSSSDSDNWPTVGIRCLLQFPHPLGAGPVLLTFLYFPLVLHLTEFCKERSFPLVRYSCPLSWCSACTSVSEGVFLLYPWREMYTMSTYSSSNLFSHSVLRASHWLYNFRNSVLYVDSELSISTEEEIYQWNEFMTGWCQSGNLSTYIMLQISDTKIEMVNL